MNQELEKISETARGLLFRSETDYPLKTFMLNRTGNLVGALKSYSGQDEDAPVEKTSLDHFFQEYGKNIPGLWSRTDQQRGKIPGPGRSVERTFDRNRGLSHWGHPGRRIHPGSIEGWKLCRTMDQAC